VLDCDCKATPGGEGQKRRKQTIRVVFPREVLSLNNPGVLMIIEKEQIPASGLAAMILRGLVVTKKHCAELLFS